MREIYPWRDRRLRHNGGMKYFSLGVLGLLVAWLCSLAAKPSPFLAAAQYQMKGEFIGPEDLSGVASINGVAGVIVSDEPRCAQAITINSATHTITAGVQLPLFPNEGTIEADLEGAAADPEHHCYYVVGSHGVSKKKGEFQDDRCHVFRIPADPQTGVAQAQGITSASLLPWLATQPALASSLRTPLQAHGFNIEGLAYKSGKLYFGVRGPNVAGHTFVIEMDPSPLFRNEMPNGKIHELPVGAGQGIREIAALPVGFLVLTGNAGSEPSKHFPASEDHAEDTSYALWWWQPQSATSLAKLLVLPKHEGKAEGLLVTKTEAAEIEVVILFDSGKNGAPLTLAVHLP